MMKKVYKNTNTIHSAKPAKEIKKLLMEFKTAQMKFIFKKPCQRIQQDRKDQSKNKGHNDGASIYKKENGQEYSHQC
jgi:hypothetical protein